MKHVAASFLLVAGATTAFAAPGKLDPRLGTALKAYVVPANPLTDDQPVAACLAERLRGATPLESVATADGPDVIVLTIGRANLGKRARAQMTATLPNGMKLWEGVSKTRSFSLVGPTVPCVIADDLILNLRGAMQKARDGK